MKLLILGSTGMLGHVLARKLSPYFEVIGTLRKENVSEKLSKSIPNVKLLSDINIEDISKLKDVIKKSKPDVIINCIGIIKQLDSAKDPIVSIKINSLFPHKLAKISNELNAKLIHFSTDCVFSGKKGNYSLQDIPDPIDLYGRSKLLGEVSGKGCLTIRSSIIGRELYTRNGLVEWFLTNIGKKIQGYRKAIYSGFTTIEMSNIVNHILNKNLDLDGIYQVASEPITKYDLLNLIKEKLSLNIDIDPTDKVISDRSLNGSEFVSKTNYKPPSWNEMIEEFAKDNSFYTNWFNEE